MDIQALLDNLSKRNIKGYYVSNLDAAREKIIELLSLSSTVGIGNSRTLKDMNLTPTLIEMGYAVLDKTLAKNEADIKKLKKLALLSDWYISGSNAISQEGHIVNIDHSGNRTAALVYGPDQVIIVMGTNKIAPTLDAAIRRARYSAAPKNARRAGKNPPCTETDTCIDCRHPERVCYNLLITEGQADPNRMTVIIVGEERGF